MDQDAYSILGVAADASHPQIRLAYRRAAQRWHPDRAGADAHARFVLIQQAYLDVGAPERRSRYDAHRRELAQEEARRKASAEADASFARAPHAAGLRERWEEWRTRPAAPAFAPRGDHASVRVKVPLADLVGGTRRHICARVAQVCSRCHGKIPQCPTCHGSGQRFVERTYDVAIPAGSPHGSVLVLRGAGHEGPMFSGPGDVLVQIWWVKAHGWSSKGAEWWKVVKLRQDVSQPGRAEIRAPDGTTGTIQWGVTDRAGTTRVLRVPGLGPTLPGGGRGPVWVELRGR